jgi:predicted transcriptional regulator
VELEEVLSSKLRMKILKIIYKSGQPNISDIARQANSNFASTAEHLKFLEAEGILQVHLYGRVRLYKFKEGSAKAKAVQNLIQVWEQSK